MGVLANTVSQFSRIRLAPVASVQAASRIPFSFRFSRYYNCSLSTVLSTLTIFLAIDHQCHCEEAV